MKVAHMVGNGKSASEFLKKPRKGLKVTCNLPPFAIPDAFATTMVDFKMMRAIANGGVVVPGDWVLGIRPKVFCDKNPGFYMKHAHQIRMFYTPLPKYAENYTKFSCGHMATHYCANYIKADEIHIYGIDSFFDLDVYSATDLYLPSDRGSANNMRLMEDWRPIWMGIFGEFPNTEFIIHGPWVKHPVNKLPNVSVKED